MEIKQLLAKAEQDCGAAFAQREQAEQVTFRRVLSCMQKERVGIQHFAASTGYGYDDIGRDTLERIFAGVMGCEDALVRPQIVSGTHALALCLFGLLRPGDQVLSAVGKPYDTLDEVIGIAGQGQGSLAEFGISYVQVELGADDGPDLEAIAQGITDQTRVVMIQRSRGYAWRPSLSLTQIGQIAQTVHAKRAEIVVMVDNCYGEFTCEQEPASVGADVVVGSLIKNPGGGLAPTGGYIAGRHDLIEQIAYRLTSPGIGREVGSYASGYQLFYQGLFLAPHVVAQATRGAILAARTFALLGFDVHPHFDDARTDIIQAIALLTPERLTTFCQGIQMGSPVDSYALPEPWDMPGYQHPVIMAAGTFVSGASIELSADAPMRAPYIAYLQGGLTYQHVYLALETALTYMASKGTLVL